MYKNLLTQPLRKPLLKSRRINVDVLRLDAIHPVVSGNKWFKLKYFIESAIATGKKGLISFGGAYSNHLVAMAYACRERNLQSAAIIRGEYVNTNSSIQQMKEAGMNLTFVSRDAYKNKSQLADEFLSAHRDFYYVPEGGQAEEGIRGAEEILPSVAGNYTHIICPVGSGTTLAGIINSSSTQQKVIGISALKVQDSVNNELLNYLHVNTNKKNFTVLFDYHFGGYAKKNPELIQFMNRFFEEENIPSDFVYTGKMFYAVDDLINKNYFAERSGLLLIHTGGLQGNRSLPPGVLIY